MNECIIPTPRSNTDDRWIKQHTRHMHECRDGEPDILLIGDSIIQKMIYYEKLWSEVCSLHPLNLGIGGDRTQHVLWRILNGLIAKTRPRIIVLHCGTNNHGNSPQQIAEGILKIVDELQRVFPSSNLLIWGLLPRGERPNEVSDRNMEVNDTLKKKLEDRPQIELICSGDALRQPDGLINVKDMYDFLHLTEQGYLKSFGPVLKRLKEILNSRKSYVPDE